MGIFSGHGGISAKKVFNPEELATFRTVVIVLGKRYRVYPRVALSSFIGSEGGKETKKFGGLAIDVLVTDNMTEPVCAIVFRGGRHEEEIRLHLDKANVPCVVLDHATEELWARVAATLGMVLNLPDDLPDAVVRRVKAKRSVEVKCPLCGAPMAYRYHGRGSKHGKPFWGCSDYPKCRAKVEIPSGDDGARAITY